MMTSPTCALARTMGLQIANVAQPSPAHTLAPMLTGAMYSRQRPDKGVLDLSTTLYSMLSARQIAALCCPLRFSPVPKRGDDSWRTAAGRVAVAEGRRRTRVILTMAVAPVRVEAVASRSEALANKLSTILMNSLMPAHARASMNNVM